MIYPIDHHEAKLKPRVRFGKDIYVRGDIIAVYTGFFPSRLRLELLWAAGNAITIERGNESQRVVLFDTADLKTGMYIIRVTDLDGNVTGSHHLSIVDNPYELQEAYRLMIGGEESILDLRVFDSVQMKAFYRGWDVPTDDLEKLFKGRAELADRRGHLPDFLIRFMIPAFFNSFVNTENSPIKLYFQNRRWGEANFDISQLAWLFSIHTLAIADYFCLGSEYMIQTSLSNRHLLIRIQEPSFDRSPPPKSLIPRLINNIVESPLLDAARAQYPGKFHVFTDDGRSISLLVPSIEGPLGRSSKRNGEDRRRR